MSQLVRFEKFHFRFTDAEVVFHIDAPLTLSRGDCIFLSGPSGVGKSTLLALMQNLIPTHMKGAWDGVYERSDFYSYYLFQNPYSQLIAPKVKEEFVFPMENANKSREYALAKLQEIPPKFFFDHLLEQDIFRCSGGECQSVLLGSILAVEPEVLFLDEPSAFLDAQARCVFYEELFAHKRLHPEMTVVIVDHNLRRVLPQLSKPIPALNEWSFTEDQELCARALAFAEYPAPQRSVSQVGLSIDMFLKQSFAPGSVVCICGRNGAGKTTLLRRLAKTYFPNLSYIAQNPEAHFLEATVQEEILSYVPSMDRHSMSALLEDFRLPISALERSPFRLSEGQKRRLSVLLGTLLQKDVILYDEPSFGQDELCLQILSDKILQLRAQTQIQIVVSHDEVLVEKIATHSFNLQGNLLWQIAV